MTVRAIFVRNQRSTSVIQYKILIIDIFDIILNILIKRDEFRNSKRLMIILFTGWECRELSRNIKIIDSIDSGRRDRIRGAPRLSRGAEWSRHRTSMYVYIVIVLSER